MFVRCRPALARSMRFALDDDNRPPVVSLAVRTPGRDLGVRRQPARVLSAGGQPEFLVVRGSTRLEVCIFAIFLVFGPPALGLVAELGVRLVSGRASNALHLSLLGIFALPLALQLLKHLEPARVMALLCAVATHPHGLRVRTRPCGPAVSHRVRGPSALGFTTFVLGVPLANDDAPGAHVESEASAPVVLVVFDEFPVSSLMDSTGRLDRARFPNFARLSDESTWYTGASTIPSTPP